MIVWQVWNFWNVSSGLLMCVVIVDHVVVVVGLHIVWIGDVCVVEGLT